jgi:hypothetical protein
MMSVYFNRRNPPPGYYVYCYLREDDTIYYVGKGHGNRAWKKHRHNGKGVHTPIDTSKIIIVYYDLTEIWAFAMERWYIRWYGRKNNGTGILLNFTDGGEGGSGRVVSDHERKIRSESLMGEKHPLFGKTQDDESNKLRSQTMMGLKRSDENKQRLKGNTNRRDKTVYKWRNIKTGEVVEMTRHQLFTTHRVSNIGRIISGEFKSCCGWELYKEPIQS